MSDKIRKKIIKSSSKSVKDETVPEILEDFKFQTNKKNQMLAFFKPEVFLDKSPTQVENIVNLIFKKFENHELSVDGAAIYHGPTLGKHKIMDRHYGVINTLSKKASKTLSKKEQKQIYDLLGIKSKSPKILGGHESFEISGVDHTHKFDEYWLSSPSSKLKSGFYCRLMTIADEPTVVVNGFHPHQLAHYTDHGRKLVVMLISTNTPWAKVRDEMLGNTFPEKAVPNSIRGTFHKNAKNYGFDSVSIANNIMHLSAGPTEALFEMDNFLKEPFGIDFIEKRALLASKLLDEGIENDKLRDMITDQKLHEELEHKDTNEAVKKIVKKFEESGKDI